MKKAYTQLLFYSYKIFIISFIFITATSHLYAAGFNKENAAGKILAVDQTITFSPVTTHTYGDADFTVSATASSGLPVSYRSSKPTIASINSSTGLVHILSPGTFDIIASQQGNATYNAADNVNQSVTITKADLTIKVNSQTRPYGVNNAALTIIYAGFKYNDTQSKLSVRPAATTTATIRSDVGIYPIKISAGASNYYNLIYDAGDINVTPAPLSITAVNKTKFYGSANPALTLTYSGFKNNQNASALTTPATLSTNVDANTEPGTYPINVSGATAGNYNITFVNGSFTVNKGTLRITAAKKTKLYGAELPALTYTVTGFVLGQTSSVFTSPVIISTTATAASPVGTYTIDVTGATADNYNILYTSSTLSVTKATLKIAANSISKIYGQATPALAYTYTGFVLNETEADLISPPVITTTAQTDSPVGIYPITVNGASSDNYNIIYTAGRLTINKAPLRIIADAKIKTYKSANPVLTYSYDGFVNNDTESDLITAPAISTTATLNSSAGIYPVTIKSATATNYAVTFINSTLTVNKADLIIKANDITRVYGTTVPLFTFTYAGFVDNDTENVLLRKPIASAGVTGKSDAGTYTITPSGASSLNYNIIYEAGTLTIQKRTLTITAANKTKTYGANNPVLTLSYAGLVNGDRAQAILNGTPDVSTPANNASLPGDYPVELSGAVTADNYDIEYINGTLTVNKAVLRVTAVNKTKVYGQPNPVLSYTYTGFVNGDDASDLTIQPDAPVTTADAGSPAGSYPITVSGGTANNYTFQYVAGRLIVNKATLTVNIDPQTKVYGQPNPALTASYTGFVNGDTQANIVTQPTFTTVDGNSAVGTYTITGTGGVDENYAFRIINSRLTITPASLTITANNAARSYGINNPPFTLNYSGLVNGDDVSTALTTSPVASTAAITNSPQGIYAITVSGAVSTNYTINYVPGTLTITKAQLFVKADNKSRIYGDANPVFTFSYSGFVNGDNESVITAVPVANVNASAGSNVGTYTITPSGGSTLNNSYDLVYQTGTLIIEKAPLNIAAQNLTRIYGGANPNFVPVCTGFVNGETTVVLTAQPVAGTTATTNSAVGNYPITFSGAVAANYTISYTPASLTITPATLIITANNKSRLYGAANPTFNFNYSGFAAGDSQVSLTTAPTASTNATITSAVGNYDIVPTGAASPNYNFVYNNGVLTIGKAQLTVTADNKIKVYGAANPLLTVSYTGFINGDNAASLTTPATAITVATTASSSGTYAIVPSNAASLNYDFTYVNGALTVNKAALTVVAENKSKVYGAANPAFTYTINGFANGDNLNVLTAQPVGVTAATPNSGVGNYPINFTGASAVNYTFNYTPGTLAVTAAILTVTANNKFRNYGAANPAFDFAYNGFVNGDNESNLINRPVASTTATAASSVGTYSIVPAGAASANYSFVYNNGVLTVNKATLTIIADDKTKVYGTVNPALTVTYSGLINGDTQAAVTTQATVTTTATAASGAGSYSIVPSGAVATNYDIIYNNGTLAVNKSSLTVTANSQTKAFGQANPALTVTYSGFVNNDGASSLTTQPTAATTATATSPAGNYPIIPAGAVAANYSFSYVNGTLTITGGSATIDFAQLPAKTFGDADFAPRATNNVNEQLVYTSSNPAVATIINGNIHITGAGNTVIAAAFPSSSNYSQVTPVSQLFVVNKASQIITFNAIPVIIRGESYTIPTATSSSGLPVILEVKDPAIASLRGLTLTGLQVGTTTISAFQSGNENYNVANTAVQTLQVKNNGGKADLQVHLAMSPNGDGENDVFYIEGIKDHPDNQVTVINRNGVKIYETKGYDNASKVFDGHSNITGALQQPGTYFYLIQYSVNGEGKRLTGAFVIKY